MSYFGELNVNQSRAVSDDEDDELELTSEEVLATKKTLHWFESLDRIKNQFTTLHVDEIILAYDAVSTAFIYAYLLNHHQHKILIGTISTNNQFNVERKNLSSESYLNKSSLCSNYVYYLTLNYRSYLVIQCYESVKPDDMFDITNELVRHIHFDSASLFCSQHKANYYGNNLKRLPSIKYLTNNVNTEISCCERLKEPNFLTGLPAELFNVCIALNRHVVAYVCYTSTFEIDIQSVKEMYNVLSKSTIKELLVDNKLTKDTLTSLTNLFTSLSTLYL